MVVKGNLFDGIVGYDDTVHHFGHGMLKYEENCIWMESYSNAPIWMARSSEIPIPLPDYEIDGNYYNNISSNGTSTADVEDGICAMRRRDDETVCVNQCGYLECLANFTGNNFDACSVWGKQNVTKRHVRG